MIDSDALADLIAELIGDHVERATAPLLLRIVELEHRLAAQPGADGFRTMIEDAVAALPPPPTPEAITPEDLAPLIKATVQRAVAALPAPKDGESVDPAVVRGMVDEAVAALPPPPAPEAITAKDLAPLIEETVQRTVAALPTPKDGESVDPAVVRSMIDEAVAALPPAADGVGLADALIDRSGELVLTLTDGSIRKLGQVVGRDADMAALQRQLQEMVDAIPKPKDAFSLDDLSVESADGGRTIRLSFSAGGLSKSFELAIPVTIYRGVWREGQYKAGDAVTWAGSLWIANEDTAAKPDTGESWQLAVKRGRDARPANL